MRRRLLALAVAVAGMSGCDAFRPAEPDVRYIAFGDSATSGSEAGDYPAMLRDTLGWPRESLAVEAEGGETTADGLERLRSLIAFDVFPNAEVLLYWQGGADLVDFIGEVDPFLLIAPSDPGYLYNNRLDSRLNEIQSEIEAAVHAGLDAGWDVYLATYFPLQENVTLCPPVPFDILLPGQAERANEYIAALNEHIRDAATATGATLVDIATQGDALLADADNYLDCNHLDDGGNEIVAEAFADALAVD